MPRSWGPVLRALGDPLAFCPQLPGHGGDPIPSQGPFDVFVQDVAARLPPICGTLVGYSLGARLALNLALSMPERVQRLVLVGVHPGLTTDAERQERRRLDEAWAQRIRTEGLEKFVDAWSALPLFATQRRMPEDRREQQRAERLGHLAEDLALAFLGMGLSAMPNCWPRLTLLSCPCLVVVGAEDARFVAISEAMLTENPRIRRAIVAGTGHNVPFEAPMSLARHIEAFEAAWGPGAAGP
jgi:2-succinyl-6-hydroxy-2,4-cyclohexadiene-1-carboxylate synthase